MFTVHNTAKTTQIKLFFSINFPIKLAYLRMVETDNHNNRITLIINPILFTFNQIPINKLTD